MSDLTAVEKRKLEKFLGMETGYVLDFSNRSFTEFVRDSTGQNIYDPRYDYGSGSKAKRTRVSDLEVKIRPNVLRSEFDHVAGRIDPHDATVGDAACNFGGDSAVAASNVQHPITTREFEGLQHLSCHGLLQARTLAIQLSIPFRCGQCLLSLRSHRCKRKLMSTMLCAALRTSFA